MNMCESWTVKKAEHWKIEAFELLCWRRLLRVSWTARISKHAILKGISPAESLEGLMLKLKLQYLVTWWEELTHWKRPCCWERGEGDDRGSGGWMASSTWWTRDCASSWSWWWTGKPGMLQSIWSHGVGQGWANEPNKNLNKHFSREDILMKNALYY